jgi:hypothetical protein
MKKKRNQQRRWSRTGVRLVMSAAIIAIAMFVSPTAARAFRQIEEPASHLYVFPPLEPMGQMIRLNAANVFCTGVERLLFKFFDGDGSTLQEEIKSVACGRVAYSELPFTERTDGGSPRIYGLIAVLPPVQRTGNGQRDLCPADPGTEIGPLATSLELIRSDGSVRQTLLPTVQGSCAAALRSGRFSGAWGKTARDKAKDK